MTTVAKIVKSNGTDGGLLVSFPEIEFEDFAAISPLYIDFDGLQTPFFIESIERKGVSKAVVRLTGIRSLEDAEEVVGRTLFADVELEGDEEEDFIGWKVLDKGEYLGTVDDYEPIPGNLCLYVSTPKGQIMIPFHEDFVLSVDDANKTIDFNLPEGLH